MEGKGRETDRRRQTERPRDRQTEIERPTDRQRQTERQTLTDRSRERPTEATDGGRPVSYTHLTLPTRR